jgi:hypothetical protein
VVSAFTTVWGHGSGSICAKLLFTNILGPMKMSFPKRGCQAAPVLDKMERKIKLLYANLASL